MWKFTYQDVNKIVEEFKVYISGMSPATQGIYIDIVKEYLLNEVHNQVEKEKYEDIFIEDRIIDFQKNYRQSKVVRAGLNKLKEYFISNGKLDKRFVFEYPYIGSKNKISKEVIPINDVRNVVLGQDAVFRNNDEKIITQCMSAMYYFCLFEQRHIQMLKCSDVLLNEARIKNVRLDDKNAEKGLIKWIRLGDEAIGLIAKYIEYFDIDLSTDDFFFRMEGYRVFDNSCQNRLLANYKLKQNNFLSVNAQQLNYSMIYHYMVATEGRGVADILPIVGFTNVQLKNAVKDYFSDFGVIHNPNNIVELFDISDLENNYNKVIEAYEDDFNIDDVEGEKEEDWVSICNFYSEENDVGMDDVLLYDSMNENNQKSKDVELSRLVRSTYLAENLKLAYNNTCQLCGTRLMKTRVDAYSEAHHIRPYNKTHKGDDTIGNMIVLCPNCHSQFDNLYYAIHPNTKLVHCLDEYDKFHLTKMEFIGAHELEEKYLTYTWKLFKKR